jgi:HEXXH motif-containing protein
MVNSSTEVTSGCELGPSDIDFAKVRDSSISARVEVLSIVNSLVHEEPTLADARPLLGELANRIELMRTSARGRLMEDPVFAIWLNRMAVGAGKAASRDGDRTLFDEMLADLPSVLDRVLRLQADPDLPRIAGTPICVQMDDLDPLIQRVTPPSFEFNERSLSTLGNQRRLLPRIVQSLSDAFESIQTVAPNVWSQIVALVRIIGYLPDADFRSCSAARYPGVVYLGQGDEVVYEFEESLIHEAAHQYLYRIDEVDPIVDRHAGGSGEYELPWSGAQRDFFGYLHACFIYVALDKYFTQRLEVTNQQAAEVAARRDHIHRGLAAALPEIEGHPALTSRGSGIVAGLSRDLHQLHGATRA